MELQIYSRILVLSILLTCASMGIIIPAVAEPFWTDSGSLHTNFAAIHRLNVDSGTKVVLYSPPGSNFDLYARKTPAMNSSCPGNYSFIMDHADESSAGMGVDEMILESGLWCIVVFAGSGSGTYQIEASVLDSLHANPFGSDGTGGADPSIPGGPWSNGTWGSDGIDWVDPFGSDETGGADPSIPGGPWYNGTWGTEDIGWTEPEGSPYSGWSGGSGSPSSSGPYWTKSYPLSAGLRAMHEIQVENGAELVLHAPPGSNYDLYAMRNTGTFGSCPSNSYIMSHADKSTAGMGSDILFLEPGLWCLVVYAQSGSGTYLLEASAAESGYSDPSGSDGSGWPDPFGGSGESPGIDLEMYNPFGTDDESSPESFCGPLRSVQNSGVIEAWDDSFLDDPTGVYARDGTFIPNSDTYSFQVQGYRSDIEFIVLGPCGVQTLFRDPGEDQIAYYSELDLPDRMLSDTEIDAFSVVTNLSRCGVSYVLTVTKDCDPHNQFCRPFEEQNSHSNGYYRLTNPTLGSTYYVSIAGNEGNTVDREYQLIVRSYQC